MVVAAVEKGVANYFVENKTAEKQARSQNDKMKSYFWCNLLENKLSPTHKVVLILVLREDRI